MKKDLLNWRLWIVAIFAIFSIICLFAMPTSANDEIWWLQFAVSKIVAVLFSGIGLVLSKYWSYKGKLYTNDKED